MGLVYFPPITPIPLISEDATKEERLKVFEEYRQEMIRSYLQYFNSDESCKSVCQKLKSLFSYSRKL